MSLEDAILILAEAVQELTAAIGGKPSKPVTEDAPDPAQTSIQDFSPTESTYGLMPWPIQQDRSMSFTYYDKHRKGIARCGRCGKVGYNIRSCDRHQDL